jgi:hypothetical protein
MVSLSEQELSSYMLAGVAEVLSGSSYRAKVIKEVLGSSGPFSTVNEAVSAAAEAETVFRITHGSEMRIREIKTNNAEEDLESITIGFSDLGRPSMCIAKNILWISVEGPEDGSCGYTFSIGVYELQNALRPSPDF